jgi:hypothetical protein
MGGNLLKTKRISKNRYLEIKTKVIDYLEPTFGKDNFFIPRSLKDKESFGDLDVMLKSTACLPSWDITKESILADFKPKDYKSLPAGLSILYEDFSVDFFCLSYKKFTHAYYFLSDNCLGNMIGKIAKRLNLKFGDNGLSYVFRREHSSYKRDFIISDDFEQICNFLGLDFERWKEGFTYEEMFEWVIASPYFSANVYLEPTGDLKKRISQDRPAIVKFANYLKENNITSDFKSLLSENQVLEKIDVFFGTSVTKEIEEEKIREATVSSIQEKFNGHLLIDLLGINGKELGNFISDFKKQFKSPDDFEKFILTETQEIVNKKIIEYHENR